MCCVYRTFVYTALSLTVRARYALCSCVRICASSISVRTHIHVYINAYIHTYIHTYAYIHTYIHTHIRTYIHMQFQAVLSNFAAGIMLLVGVCVCMWAYACVNDSVFMCVYGNACIKMTICMPAYVKICM